MLDIKLIRNQPDLVRSALSRRSMDHSVIDTILEQDVRRRQLIGQADELKATRNQVSKELGQKRKAGHDISEESARMREVGEEIARLDKELAELESSQKSLLENLPSLPHPEVPDGKDDSANVEVRRWGTPREFSFEAQDHWDLAERLEILDMKRASKISGSRFWMLRGMGARLERALINFFLDVHDANGYTEIMPPALVNRQALYGTGQLPRFEEDLFKCEGTDLYLIPTSEVPITNLHAGETLDAESLPLNYCGFSPCYRSEAGAAGRDTRGLIRVHQFHKVELVKMCMPENSYTELQNMVADAERILQLLEIPYRVVRICIGDLGYTASLKYDLEFWSPPQQRWIEVSSCSDCTDYQARRANIRFKRNQATAPEFVHTLNGSGLAVGRTMVAVIDNYQQADGSILIPKALQPYMRGLERITID